MRAYLKTVLLFLALCTPSARADWPTDSNSAEEAAVRNAKDETRTTTAQRERELNDEIARLREEVRGLTYELSQAPRYFDNPEDDKLRP
jgi:hypothetical protein